MEYLNKGLLLTKKVQTAVASYREENNGIEIFLRDRCEKVPEFSVKCSVFRDSVRDFCKEEGHQIPSYPDITQYLERQGYQKTHLCGGTFGEA